jgi:uncharacterized protein YbjT (DUF2867 family)
MDRDDRIILVTGATGTQGSAATRRLLADGWRVRALSRDPTKPDAERLRQAGAEILLGNMDDPASLDAAMHGVHGVVSIQPTKGSSSAAPGFDYDDEIRLGRNVAVAATTAGVRHFLYLSGSGAGEVQRFRSKGVIEQHIRALDLPATILRPAGFMHMYADPRHRVQSGRLATPIKPDVAQPLITITDIAAFVALAFRGPDVYLGRTLEIAGDALTPPQIAAAIGRATGHLIHYVQLPLEAVAPLADYFRWLNENGCKADIPALRRLHPGLTDYDTWLEQEGKAQFEALFRAEPA